MGKRSILEAGQGLVLCALGIPGMLFGAMFHSVAAIIVSAIATYAGSEMVKKWWQKA